MHSDVFAWLVCKVVESIKAEQDESNLPLKTEG